MGNSNSSTNKDLKPLMPEATRAKTLQVFKDQFHNNENFLRDTVLVKLRMKGKLLKVRDKIMSRNNSADSSSNTDSTSNPNSPSASAGFNGAMPVPSFANFADDYSMKSKPTREEKIRDGCLLLRERIQHLKLHMDIMVDDGNCQFRSIAHQLYGDQDKFHMKVRETCVNYMKENANEFNFLFEDEKEFDRYLDGMRRDRTWGEELTLKAACNAFNCIIHVLTSEKEHYYVVYKPESMIQAESAPSSPKKKSDEDKKQEENSPPPPVDIFLAYISPIHYNSIRLEEEE